MGPSADRVQTSSPSLGAGSGQCRGGSPWDKLLRPSPSLSPPSLEKVQVRTDTESQASLGGLVSGGGHDKGPHTGQLKSPESPVLETPVLSPGACRAGHPPRAPGKVPRPLPSRGGCRSPDSPRLSAVSLPSRPRWSQGSPCRLCPHRLPSAACLSLHLFCSHRAPVRPERGRVLLQSALSLPDMITPTKAVC